MTDNKKKLILEAYRRAEIRLQSQIDLAVAADGRAVTFGGLAIAAAAILIGLAEDASNRVFYVSAAGALVVSACLAGFSARPVPFGIVGGKFGDLIEDIDADDVYEELLRTLGRFYDEEIDDNAQQMKTNGRVMFAAYLIAVVSPLVGYVASLAARI